MFKICTIIGTRPEIIKLSSLIKKLDRFFDHNIVHTGQNYDYELNQIFFEDLKIRKPDYFLNSADVNANKTISKIFFKFDEILEKIKPDAVLILGDTNSGLSSIVAKKRKLQVFHIEAGNRSFDYKVPEELNRKIIDHSSDINFTYTDIAKNYLISEGIPADRIIKVGSPMKEVINQNSKTINKSNILKKLGLKKNKFFLVSFHREENVDNKKKLTNFLNLLEWLSENFPDKIIVSTHYRTQHRLDKLNEKYKRTKKKYANKIVFLKPFNFSDYVKLQKNCNIILSDSGTLTEETSILKLKAIKLRASHERPEGMEQGTTIMCDLNISKILTAIKILNKTKISYPVDDYNLDNFSDKIVKNITSYLDYSISKKV